MTLKETIDSIKEVCLNQPNVNNFDEGSIYDILNADPSKEYTSMVLSQRQHQLLEDGEFWSFRFYLFFVDRLVSDKSNRTDVQSEALETLRNVIKVLVNAGFVLGDSTLFDVFEERFADITSGAYATFEIIAPVDGVCPEVY